MARYLIDTNVIRLYVDRQPEVESFIESSLAKNDTFFIPETVKYEILSQFVEMKKHEVVAARKLIAAFQPIEVELSDFKRAHLYRRQGRKIRKYHNGWKKPQTPALPGLADSFIAVTAINEKIDLVTNNLKDFHLLRFFGRTIIEPITRERYGPIDFKNKNTIPNEYPKS
ncbi:type II toxin-antitoxin system VapC family toxin [Robertmurraya andreesenii]|uniref:Nucleic acid-binding protein n=1 Tax=Anoxybacillus andreesenii TaxID=1325932 RepID=A0ABT9V6D7_9BACL|nr:PIN domain-containing protein [Robertmurraya andreesenii]MDQ0156517.1 putative nucleic acid-binding protein [Robertmurraya andreesenii]